MSYPPTAWPPPPMPSDYSYGKRAWNNGAWMAGPVVTGNVGLGVGWRAYPGFGRPQQPPPHEDYWATELKDNPLGLENMHIRETDVRARGQGQGQTQGKSSHAYAQPRPQHGRIGQQNLVWVPALNDNERVRGRNSHHAPLNTTSHEAPVVRASSQPPAISQSPIANTSNPNANRRPSSRNPSPAAQPQHAEYASTGHYAYADQQAQGNSSHAAYARPQSSGAHRGRDRDREAHRGFDHAYNGRANVPADMGERYAGTGAYDASKSNLNPNRSQTLATHHRHASAPPMHGASTVKRSQTMPVEPTHARAAHASQKHVERYDYECEDDGDGDDDDDYVVLHAPAPPSVPPKESGSMQRVRAWIADGSRQHEAPKTRRTADGYEQDEAYVPVHQPHSYPSSRDGIVRRASAPAVTAMNPAVAGVTMSDITEEPDDLSLWRRPPVDNFTSSDSDSLEDRPRRPRVRTPHPSSSRHLPEYGDTLRVDGGAAHALPSPRSLQQSSRIPSARSSYEYVNVERERDRERVKSPAGHLSPGKHGGQASYSTPPITPNRQDYMYRHDGTRESYTTPSHQQQIEPISIPGSATKRAGARERSPSFQTPARLTYLYRGNSASPSPYPRADGAAPSSAPRPSSSQQQIGYPEAVVPTKVKGRSPRASRSPGHLTSGSSYYGTVSQQNTPARAAQVHGHGHSHGHSHGGHGHDGRRQTSLRAAAVAAAASTTRHVRAGFWNRRGDHLTETGHVVYCPPGRNFPKDLADYPDNAFRDHLGNVITDPPDRYPELPETVPQSAGRTAARTYDSFIKYVMVNG